MIQLIRKDGTLYKEIHESEVEDPLRKIQWLDDQGNHIPPTEGIAVKTSEIRFVRQGNSNQWFEVSND